MKSKGRFGNASWRRFLADAVLLILGLTLASAAVRMVLVAPYLVVLGPTSGLGIEPEDTGDTTAALVFGLRYPFVLSQWAGQIEDASERLHVGDLVLFQSGASAGINSTVSHLGGNKVITIGRLLARSGEVIAVGGDENDRTMVQPGTVLVDPIGPQSQLEVEVQQIEAKAIFALWKGGVLSLRSKLRDDSKTP